MSLIPFFDNGGYAPACTKGMLKALKGIKKTAIHPETGKVVTTFYDHQKEKRTYWYKKGKTSDGDVIVAFRWNMLVNNADNKERFERLKELKKAKANVVVASSKLVSRSNFLRGLYD